MTSQFITTKHQHDTDIHALLNNLNDKLTFLSIDYGNRHTGLALGYWPDLMVVPLITLQSSSVQPLIDQIMKIITDRGVNHIVIGLPVHKHGHSSTINDNISALYNNLKTNQNQSVFYWDERYTSQLASRMLQDYESLRQKNNNTRSTKTRTRKNQLLNKSSINQLSAANILETFLSFLSYKTQDDKSTDTK